MVLRVCGPPRRFARGAGFRCPVLAAGASARSLARDGAASVRRRVPLRTGGAKLRIFTMRKCSGRAIFSVAATRMLRLRETKDGKKSGGRFRLSSRFVRQFGTAGSDGMLRPVRRASVCAPDVAVPQRLSCPVRDAGGLRRLSGRVRRRGSAACVWVRRRSSPRPPELEISRAPRRRRPRGSPCSRTPRAGGLRARRRPRCP